MATHIFYIDDSGTKEYALPGELYDVANGGKSRYFVFAGALLSQLASNRLANAIAGRKLKYFHTPNVEIKSNWLRIPDEREKRYLKPYGISSADLNQFVTEYYELILKSDIMFLAGVVDKQQVQEDYEAPWYAPAIAYEILLQRLQMQLSTLAQCDVSIVVDDMQGATPAGRTYKMNLDHHHKYLRQYGSRLQTGFTFPSIAGNISFRDSARSHQIQVADIIAYNVMRQFREFGEEWEKEDLQELPTYGPFAMLVEKFRQSLTGRIQGYGIAKYPMKKRGEWGIKKS